MLLVGELSYQQLGYDYLVMLLVPRIRFHRDILAGIVTLHLFDLYVMSCYPNLRWCSVDDHYFSFHEIEFELVLCKSCIPGGHTLFMFVQWHLHMLV